MAFQQKVGNMTEAVVAFHVSDVSSRRNPSMKILASVAMYNTTVDRALAALARQTVPLDEILIVDNASPHGVGESLPPNVTVIRNAENLGTSGSTAAGLKYGLERGYEWVWVLDADTNPRPDALQWLCDLYRGLPEADKHQIGILGCSHILVPTQQILRGRRFTPGGPRPIHVAADVESYDCDAVIWAGSLYNLEAVSAVGFPRCGSAGVWEDLSHDYGDMEFSNRIRSAGYRILVHTRSLVEQPIGHAKVLSIFGYSILSTNHAAWRRYLYFRNMVFFWIHLYPRKNWVTLSLWMAFRLSANTSKILIMEQDRPRKIRACFQGFGDGLMKRMTARF
jgi:GT2 family glycosyltransferase